MTASLAGRASEDVRVHQRRTDQVGSQIVLQSIREMECCLLGNVLDAFEQRLVAVPANLDAAKEIGLRPRHLEHAIGLERSFGSKNFRVGLKADPGSATVGCAAGVFQFAFVLATLGGTRTIMV